MTTTSTYIKYTNPNDPNDTTYVCVAHNPIDLAETMVERKYVVEVLSNSRRCDVCEFIGRASEAKSTAVLSALYDIADHGISWAEVQAQVKRSRGWTEVRS